jgi:probable phosphoglycerate mutase
VRHGQSTFNAQGRIQGSSNESLLTERGQEQAHHVQRILAGVHFDCLFKSPLERASHTADIIWNNRSGNVTSLYGLREIDLFSFEGMLKSEGKRLFGDAFATWQSDPANFVIDGRMPVPELWERARTCWDDVLDSNASSILLVAHNAVLQALVCTALGVGPSYFRHLLQSNCGVSVLDFGPPEIAGDPCVVIERLNETPSFPTRSEAPRSPGGRLVIVVHGQDEAEAESKIAGSDNGVSLSGAGVTQSSALAGELSDSGVESILYSPQARARETADAIADNLRGFGNMCERSGLNDISLQAEAPGGEPLHSLFERAQGELREAFREFERGRETVAMVTHTAVARALLCCALGMDEQVFRRFRADEGSVSVVDFQADRTATCRNTNFTAHLQEHARDVNVPSAGVPVAAAGADF